MSAYLRSKNLNNLNSIRIEAVDSDSFGSTILSSNGEFLLPSGNVNTGSGSLRYNPFTDRAEVRSNAGLRAIATEIYVDDAIRDLIDGAPATLDTLNELAAALNDDENFASNVLTSLNNRLRIDIDQNLTLPQKIQGRNNLGLATVAASGSYNDLTNRPSLFSGNYNDLTNRPTITSYNQSLNTTNDVTFNSVTAKSIDVDSLEFTGTGPIVISSGNDLSFNAAGDIKFNGSKLSAVAISGSYNDLTNKPAIPNDLLDLGVTDGTFGQVLTTDGSGNFYFEDLSSSVVDVNIVGEEIVFGADLLGPVSSNTLLHPVATSGNYNALNNLPTIPTALSQLSNDSNFISSVDWSEVQSKPDFATVAITADYENLINTPLIPQDIAQLSDITGRIPTDISALTDLNNVLTGGAPVSWNNVIDKPTVNYTQTIGNPVFVPSSAVLPYTVISGTITTTGNPVRIHVCGDLYQTSGGFPRIQIFRGTAGLGRRMTVRNAGVAGTAFAIEVIDLVEPGTYTYSLQVVSDVGNGIYFGQQDGNMLNIVELK